MLKFFKPQKFLNISCNLSTSTIPLGKVGGRSSSSSDGKGNRTQSIKGVIPITIKTSKSRPKSKEATAGTTSFGPSSNFPIPSPNLVKTPKIKKFKNSDEFGLPLLNPQDCFRRVEFASKMLEILSKDPDVLDAIIFSDEGNFNLVVPRKKKALKDEEDKRRNKETPKKSKNQRKYNESKRLPQIVWCGMTSRHIIGPYFFNSYVTERTYQKMLQTFLIPQLGKLGGMGAWFFQQDGAPPHRSRQLISYLTKTFGPRLISYGSPLAWPSKSQDLTPLDYFLWKHLKEKLSNNFLPEDLTSPESLRRCLTNQIDEMDEELLRRMVHQFPKRLEKCIAANGERFEYSIE